jgi:hypothetical protein
LSSQISGNFWLSSMGVFLHASDKDGHTARYLNVLVCTPHRWIRGEERLILRVDIGTKPFRRWGRSPAVALKVVKVKASHVRGPVAMSFSGAEGMPGLNMPSCESTTTAGSGLLRTLRHHILPPHSQDISQQTWLQSRDREFVESS